MGGRHTKGVLEYFLKDQSFRSVHWLSIVLFTANDQPRIHQFGKKVLPGLFVGYALYAAWIWKGDILVADTDGLGNVDTSQTHPRRLNAKPIFTTKNGEHFRWNSKLVWRISWDLEIHLDARPIRKRQSVQRWSARKFGHLSANRRDDGGQRSPQCFSVDERELHSLNQEFSSLCRRKKHSQYPLRYIDVVRTTHTTFDVLQECRIDDYWNIDANRNLLEPRTVFTQFTTLNQHPPDGCMVREMAD